MTKNYKLFALAVLLFCGTTLWADVLTVADGTATNGNVPIYGAYMDTPGTHTQAIYPKSSLSSMAGASISAISFYSANATAKWTDAVVQVSLKEVDNADAEVIYENYRRYFNTTEAADVVYTGSLALGEGGVMTINFANEFAYSGENHLLVDILVTTKGSWENSSFYGVTQTTGHATSMWSKDNGSASGSSAEFMPKITFVYEVASAGSCAKPTNVQVSATPDGCVATWEGAEDTQYQWCAVEKDAAAAGWELLDANVFTKTVTGLTAGTAYDFYVRQYCSNSDQSDPVKKAFTPECKAPVFEDSQSIGSTTATISWKAVAGISKFQYLCVAKDADTTGLWAAVEAKEGLSAELTGLTAHSNYDFYVRSWFSASVQSTATKLPFQTQCAAEVVDAEHSFEYEFESALSECWSNATYTSYQWTVSYEYNSGYDYFMQMATRYSGNAYLQTPSIQLTDASLLTFKWQNTKGATANVLISTDGGSTKASVNEAIGADLSKTYASWTEKTVDLSAYSGTVILYFYAQGGTGSSSYARINDVAISLKPVAAPTNLAAEAGDASANITWDNAEGTTWNLRYRVQNEGEWTTEEGLTANSKELTGLTNGTTYEVQVQAVCSANRKSAWTASATFAPVACATVETVTYGAKTYNSIVVNWTASAAGTWDIHYKAAGDADWTSAGTGLAEATKTLTGLSTGVSYTVEVKAACGDAWVAGEAFELAYSKPATASVTGATDAAASASWDAVADAPDGYKYIVVARDAEPVWSAATATNTNELTASLTGLDGLTDYDFYVCAVYGSELGAATKAQFATIAVAPTDLVQGTTTTESITFSWSYAGAATQFQYKVNDDGWSAPQSALTAMVDGLDAGTTYTIYVRAWYADGKESSELSENFATACAVYGIPYEQNFGTVSGTEPNCWTIANWGTSANSWTTAGDFAKTGMALRYNARTLNSADAVSPSIEITDKCELKFYVKNSVGNASAKVESKVLVNDGTTTTEVASITTRYTTATLQTIDLSAYEGKTITIIFRGVGYDTSGSPYLWIDDVAVTVKPCEAAQSNLVATPNTTGAVVTWDAEGDAQFEWCVVEKDAEAAGWALLAEGVHSVTVTGKTHGTEYDVYVRTYCSATRQSEASKVTFEPSEATAISNADAAAKATKRLENGQLIIELNGVQYNAQGAMVK